MIVKVAISHACKHLDGWSTLDNEPRRVLEAPQSNCVSLFPSSSESKRMRCSTRRMPWLLRLRWLVLCGALLLVASAGVLQASELKRPSELVSAITRDGTPSGVRAASG